MMIRFFGPPVVKISRRMPGGRFSHCLAGGFHRAVPVASAAATRIGALRLLSSSPPSRPAEIPPLRCASYAIANPYNAHALIGTLGLGTFSDADLDVAFDRIDADHDGKLSAAELRRHFGEYAAERNLSEEELGRMTDDLLAQWDDNGDGDVDRDEFRRHARAVGRAVHPSTYQLAAGVALTVLPVAILVPFEPQLVAKLGITSAGFGLAQGAFFLTNVLVGVPMTQTVARHGSKPIYIGSLLMLGCSVASVSLAGTLPQLVAARAVGGAALSGIVTSVMAGVVRTGTPLNRVTNMAVLSQARNAGMAAGPAVGGLLGGIVSMETAFAVVGGTLFLSAAAFHNIYRDVAPGSGPGAASSLEGDGGAFANALQSWRIVLNSVPEAAPICLMSAIGWGTIAGTNYTLLPLLLSAEPIGASTAMIGGMLAANAAVGVATGGVIGRLAQEHGPRMAIGVGAGTISLSMAAVPLAGDPALVLGAMVGMQLGKNWVLFFTKTFTKLSLFHFTLRRTKTRSTLS